MEPFAHARCRRMQIHNIKDWPCVPQTHVGRDQAVPEPPVSLWGGALKTDFLTHVKVVTAVALATLRSVCASFTSTQVFGMTSRVVASVSTLVEWRVSVALH